MIELFESIRKVHKYKKTHVHYLVPAMVLIKYYGGTLTPHSEKASYEWLLEINDREIENKTKYRGQNKTKTTVTEDFKNEKTKKITRVKVEIKEQIEAKPPLHACEVEPEPQ